MPHRWTTWHIYWEIHNYPFPHNYPLHILLTEKCHHKKSMKKLIKANGSFEFPSGDSRFPATLQFNCARYIQWIQSQWIWMPCMFYTKLCWYKSESARIASKDRKEWCYRIGRASCTRGSRCDLITWMHRCTIDSIRLSNCNVIGQCGAEAEKRNFFWYC